LDKLFAGPLIAILLPAQEQLTVVAPARLPLKRGPIRVNARSHI
jgi:hypothetical protein